MNDILKKNFLNKRKRIHPKFKIHDLLRAADLRKTFSKGDTNIWSINFMKIQKLLMIQHRVIALTSYQSVILKHY